MDCTLRDGGYVNNWRFGDDKIRCVIDGLQQAHVDIIECGYLNDHATGEVGSTQFRSVEDIAPFLHKDGSCMYVAMVDFGKMDIDAVADCDGTSVDGIRVAFHKKDLNAALEYCSAIKAKGYQVFIQPMVSMNYSDQEFIALIQKVNEIEPYAFYIVDSFGVMKRKDLVRMYYLVEHNLCSNVLIGYHSHNNLQLAYANAQTLVDIQTNRRMIIDSSIFGMGRGAGNLNTELFVEFLNDCFGKKYEINPLLQVMDQALNSIYYSNYWGYSLPHYLSAIHNCHPNYASYLDDKKTLTVENLSAILTMLPPEKKSSYDKQAIEALYRVFMSNEAEEADIKQQIEKKLKGKRVLVIGPGKSGDMEKDLIRACAAEQDVISVSVNFEYPHCCVDYIFLSNLRRARTLGEAVKCKTMVTSNIKAEGYLMQIDYEALLNNYEHVSDNAGLMLVNYLIQLGVAEVILAGIDGYSYDITQNYAADSMAMQASRASMDAMNEGMSAVLTQYSRRIKLRFLTTPRNVKIG